MMSAWATALSSALLVQLAFQVVDTGGLVGNLHVEVRGINLFHNGRLHGHRSNGGSFLGIVELILQTGDDVVELVNLVGNMLKEHIHLIDIVTLAVDGEALVVDVGGGDSHVVTLALLTLPLLPECSSLG